MLETRRYSAHFFVHWLGAALVVVILAQLLAAERSDVIRIKPDVFTFLICIITVILLSAEDQLLINALYYSKANDLAELARIYNKTGLPILWGLCSFAFM